MDCALYIPYRYGFNGQEKDNEVGEGITTALYWEYDSRIGRRWNIDPMAPKYAWQSPYACFNNNPIYYSDPLGLEGDPPKDQQVIKTGDGGYMNIPASATLESYGKETIKNAEGTEIKVDASATRAFTIDGNRYVSTFNKEGVFTGYYSASNLKMKYVPEGIIFQDKVTSDFKNKLLEVCYNLKQDPNKLMAVMAQETGETFKPDIWNGKTAVGLIQFTGIALKAINQQKNTSYTKESVSKMTAVDQLDLVQAYYQTPILKKATFKTIEDYAVATFSPANVGKASSNVIYKTGSVGYTKNSSLDKDGDGNITNGELGIKYAKKYVTQ